MATAEVVALTAPHPPTETELSAFGHVAKEIKAAILKSRAHWDKHEPKMWSRVAGISDHDLVDFHVRDNLVEVRDGVTPYGTVLFGKIRIPAVKDGQGEGFVHVRIHDARELKKDNDAVLFHALFTWEGDHDHEGRPKSWKAIQDRDTPLEWFNE